METFKCDFCDTPDIIEKPKIEPPKPVQRKVPEPVKRPEPQKEETVDYRKMNYDSNEKRSNMRKKKKKISAKRIVLSVLGLMLLFAISVTAFYMIISRALNKDNEPMATAEPTVTAETVATAEPTRTPLPTEKLVKATEKPVKATEKPVKATEKPTNRPPESMSNSLYPSDKRVITERELEELSREEIKLIYYEIYARHGMTFDDDFLIEFFENRKGYVPTETDEDEVEAKFNDNERENIEVIEQYQIEQGWRKSRSS